MKKYLALTIFLGYLMPGLGHFYLGERKRAGIFFFSLLLLFGLGWAIGGGILWDEMNILTVLAYVVNFFNGAAFIVMIADHLFRDLSMYYHEVGTMLMLISGALNILVILNACDLFYEKIGANP